MHEPLANSSPQGLERGWVAERLIAPVLKFACVNFLRLLKISQSPINTRVLVVSISSAFLVVSLKIRLFQEFGEQFGEQHLT